MSDPGIPTVQLRLDFARPQIDEALTVRLSIIGMQIGVEVTTGSRETAFRYLEDAGAEPVFEIERGVYFPASHLTAVKNLPDFVNVAGEPALSTLLLCVKYPSQANYPAKLSVEASGDLILSWFDGESHYEEILYPEAAASLFASKVSFVATPEAWDVLKSVHRLPILTGYAKLNPDGYVEIATATPQLVESAPIPGLFRIDDTHFGVALPYVSAIDSSSGFSWSGRKPVIERGPGVLPPLPLNLYSDQYKELHLLTDALAAYRARVLVGTNEAVRDALCLGAIESLDAWPLLVLTVPHKVYAWKQLVASFKRTSSLVDASADVLILTYLEFARYQVDLFPQAIVFDQMETEEPLRPDVYSSLKRLDAFSDAYRLAPLNAWPENNSRAMRMMAALRPKEFLPQSALAHRYPVDGENRAAEHVDAYVQELPSPVNVPMKGLRVVRTLITDLLPAQKKAFEGIGQRLHGCSSRQVWDAVADVVSAGPEYALSPKIANAVELAREAFEEEGRTCAVLTSSPRTQILVKSALRPLPVTSTWSGSTPLAVVLMQQGTPLPDLARAERIVVVDYPHSMEEFEQALTFTPKDFTQEIVFLHTTYTPDDRAALLAADRPKNSGPFSEKEISYLLSSR